MVLRKNEVKCIIHYKCSAFIVMHLMLYVSNLTVMHQLMYLVRCHVMHLMLHPLNQITN